MKFRHWLRRLASPPGAVIVPLLLSFVAWSVPAFGVLRKGFDHPQPLFSQGGMLVCVWYGIIILCALFGERLGRALAPAGRQAQAYVGLNDVFTYRLLSVIGALGAGYSIYYAGSKMGAEEITNLISNGQANKLKKALYDNYSIGLPSLRYVVILSGGLAIYRLITGLSRGLWEIANLAALLGTTLLSSRLSLVAAVFSAGVLFVTNNPPARIPWTKILLGGAALFALLSFFNMTRNKGFYEKSDSGGFLVSGLSEIIAYLGAPFQGSLAAGNYFGSISRGMDAIRYTDISTDLSTNSAFLELLDNEILDNVGAWCFLLVALTSFGAALIIGLLRHQMNTHFGLISCVLLYCYAELWRIFLFAKGIVFTLLAVAFGVPLAVMALKALLASSCRKRAVGLRSRWRKTADTEEASV